MLGTQGALRPWTTVACAAALAAALLWAGLAAGDADARNRYVPPKGKIWHGVSDTGDLAGYQRFNRQVRHHTPLLQTFYHWGVPLTTGALDRWASTGTRGVLSLSTAPGGKPEVITPKEIATGRDDHYMLRLNQSIANSGQVVYIRPFAEMNLHYNPYSGFKADGSLRSPAHRPRWYKLAWRRLVTIVRGGSRDKINRKLRRMGLPRIHRAKSNNGPIYEKRKVPAKLKRPKVAFMWMPMTISNPNIRKNRPMAYWPGRRYVDWVGTDIYARYATPGVWSALDRFFHSKAMRGLPFAIGEYGPWNNDRRGHFVRRLFRWAKKHRRVKALIYFRSVNTDNEFNLQYYPGARRELRRQLRSRRFPEYAPGTRKNEKKPGKGHRRSRGLVRGARADAPLERPQLPQPRPALSQAAVHLGVGPAGELADLRVGVAHAEQDERALLGGLEAAQGAGALVRGLAALEVLRGAQRGTRVAVRGLGREQALALAPQGERLAAHDQAHPGDETGRRVRRGLGEQDQGRALQRVLGVVQAQREAPRRAAEQAAVGVEERHRAPAPGELFVHANGNPGAPAGAPAEGSPRREPREGRARTLPPASFIRPWRRGLIRPRVFWRRCLRVSSPAVQGSSGRTSATR